MKGLEYIIPAIAIASLHLYLIYRLMLAAARKAVWEYAEWQNKMKQEETLEKIEKELKEKESSNAFTT